MPFADAAPNPPSATPPGRAHSVRPPSWRLLLLIAVVLYAHWAVLRAAPLSLAAHANPDSDASWVFATRTIAAPDPAQKLLDSDKPALATPPRKAPERRPAPTPAPAPAAPPQLDADNAAKPVLQEPPAVEAVAPTATTALVPMEGPVVVADASESGTVALAVAAAAPSAPAALAPAQAVHSFSFPASTRLKYDVKGEAKGFPYSVNGELLWKQDGKTYDARMVLSHFLLGSRTQTSVGQLTPFGLEPTRFGDKSKSEVAAHFDYDKHKITFSANTPDVAMLAGAQDQLSVLIQLGAMIAGEPARITAGSSFPFQAIGPRSAESWVFTVGSPEKLSLPGGEINALRLTRESIGEFAPKMEIWLAPTLGYLPARIRLTQNNGDVLDQQWRGSEAP